MTFRRARLSRTQRRQGSRARLRVVAAFRGNSELRSSRKIARARLHKR